jgi:hypothetical protein
LLEGKPDIFLCLCYPELKRLQGRSSQQMGKDSVFVFDHYSGLDGSSGIND